MPPDVEDGKLIARNTICGRFRGSIDFFRVDSLPAPAYGFDPSGWLIYSVRQNDVFCVQGDWMVAVHSETGEFKDLGRLGD